MHMRKKSWQTVRSFMCTAPRRTPKSAGSVAEAPLKHGSILRLRLAAYCFALVPPEQVYYDYDTV